MKLILASLAFIKIAIVVLIIEESSPANAFQKDKMSVCSDIGLWHQGKVPYAISHQFG